MKPYMPKIKSALELMPEGEREKYMDILRSKGGFHKKELISVQEISKKVIVFIKKYYCCDGDILLVEYEKKSGNPRCTKYEIIKEEVE